MGTPVLIGVDDQGSVSAPVQDVVSAVAALVVVAAPAAVAATTLAPAPVEA